MTYHGAGRSPGIVAMLGSRIVGYARRVTGTRHPTFDAVGVHVHPGFRRQGTGAALWQAVTRDAGRPLKTAAFADQTGALRFLEARGLTVRMTTHLPHLDPAQVDAAQVAGWAREAQAHGFTLQPMTALDGPDLRRRLTRLHLDVYAHSHPHDPPADETDEDAEEDFLGTGLRPEWLWVARRGEALAGVSSVRDMGDPARAELAWFGVPRAFAAHGRVLTLALTGLALRRAAADGVSGVWPELDSADPHALNLLGALPWRPGKTWLTLRRGA